MLRGAEMLFAAIFSVVFLKRTLNKYNYIGIVCCLVSVTLPFLCFGSLHMQHNTSACMHAFIAQHSTGMLQTSQPCLTHYRLPAVCKHLYGYRALLC